MMDKVIIDSFLDNRRNEETKAYVKLIIDFLSKHDSVEIPGWVRVKEMQAALVDSGDIPFNTTFFRLLDEMVKCKIIEKMETERELGARGKRPIYYRVPFHYPDTWFMTRDELLNEVDSLREKVKALEEKARG
jgi:hypothetical protein